MGELKLIFILRQNTLYIVVRGDLTELSLSSYSFNSTLPVSSGTNGNHLFKATGPIEDVRAIILSKLQKRERLLFRLYLLKVSGIFISERYLNNLEIKHYCDFLEQANCRSAIVYHDRCLAEMEYSYLRCSVGQVFNG